MLELLSFAFFGVATAVALAVVGSPLLFSEWFFTQATRARWRVLGHPWRQGVPDLNKHGTGAAQRLNGVIDGHRVGVGVAFPSAGRLVPSGGALRPPNTVIQVEPRIRMPAGLEVWPSSGPASDPSVEELDPTGGPARVRTSLPEVTKPLLARPPVREALVELAHRGLGGRLDGGVLEVCYEGVLPHDEVAAEVHAIVALAETLVRPIDEAWKQLCDEHNLELSTADAQGHRSASGVFMGGLLIRASVHPVDGPSELETQLRVGLPPGAPLHLSLAAPGTSVPHLIELPTDHPLHAQIACGGEDPAGVLALLETPAVVDGVREIIGGWPQVTVHGGALEAALPGQRWHDLEERLLSMAVLAWLLAGEPIEAIPSR
jgi:hypothetical protein